MNIITSSIFLILALLGFPMAMSLNNMTKHINFPNYMTSCIKCALFISPIPLSSFFNSDTEFMITKW